MRVSQDDKNLSYYKKIQIMINIIYFTKIRCFNKFLFKPIELTKHNNADILQFSSDIFCQMMSRFERLNNLCVSNQLGEHEMSLTYSKFFAFLL